MTARTIEGAADVLLVEDNGAHAELIQRAFDRRSSNFALRVAPTLGGARDLIAASTPDVVIADVFLPDGRATDLLPDEDASFPIVLITSQGDEKLAVEAMKAGAFDYIVKTKSSIPEMPRIVEKTLEQWEEKQARKRLEEELASTKALLTGALDQTPVGIIIADAPDLRLRFANPHSHEIFGFSLTPAYATELPFHHLDGTPHDSESSLLWSAVRDGEPLLNYEALVGENGSEMRRVLANAAPIRNEQGQIIAGILVFSDISQLRQLEARLRESQKLEAVGKVAGGVAHEFNNALTVINGYSEIALAHVQSGSELAAKLEQIFRAGERAKQIASQLLTFSREVHEERTPVRPYRIVKEVLASLQPLRSSTIDVQTKVSDEEVVVIANSTQLHQALLNLCKNAMHAMGDARGTLTVEVTTVTADGGFRRAHPEMAMPEYVQISVSDTGRGMNRATAERVFEPFFTTKQKAEGSGLGLSVVHGIIVSHGGDIGLRSEPHRGTRVDIWLPRADLRFRDEIIQRQREVPRGDETILFVDDEASVVDVLSSFLRGLGYTVEGVVSPQKALEMLSSKPNHFDAMVTDQLMPGMTGVELANHVHAIRPDLPVVLCSGSIDRISLENCGAGNIAAILPKPLTSEELGRAIRDALDARHSPD